jgi:hypothetical protein
MDDGVDLIGTTWRIYALDMTVQVVARMPQWDGTPHLILKYSDRDGHVSLDVASIREFIKNGKWHT